MAWAGAWWTRRGGRAWAAGCALAFSIGLSAWLAAPSSATAAPPPTTVLRVVGGYEDLSPYTRHEEPFWTQELPALTGGRLRGDIVAADRAGIRGQDMLRLMSLGVVPFGTALVNLAASSDPLLSAPDLAGLNPDLASLRRNVEAFRPQLARLLRERHGVELLALYIYPAQVLFCRQPFRDLGDLAGRRVRTASATQVDFVEALGATAVTLPFNELAFNVRSGTVDCTLTGSMTGHVLGLHEWTSHVHPMAINWGLAIFGAHQGAWRALAEFDRLLIARELGRVEQAVWEESGRETTDGLRCLAGQAPAVACGGRAPGHMTVLAATPADEQRRRQILASRVLPNWVQRCGGTCATAWNEAIGPASGIEARPR